MTYVPFNYQLMIISIMTQLKQLIEIIDEMLTTGDTYSLSAAKFWTTFCLVELIVGHLPVLSSLCYLGFEMTFLFDLLSYLRSGQFISNTN